MSLENCILILQVHSCLVEPSTARHEAHRGDSGFAEANAGLQPAAVLKPDRKSTRLNSSHSGESRMPSSA